MAGQNHMACCCLCDITNINEGTIADPDYGWDPEPQAGSGSMLGTFHFVATELCGGDAPDLTEQGGIAECNIYFAVAMDISYSVSGYFRGVRTDAWIERDTSLKCGVVSSTQPNPCDTYEDSDSDNELSVSAGWHTFKFVANPVTEGLDGWEIPDHAIEFSVTWTPA